MSQEPCDDCDSKLAVCSNCPNEKQCPNCEIYVNEWLELNNTCSMCSRLMCHNCAVTCYGCANSGNYTRDMCLGCAGYKLICVMHRWYICLNCPEVCGQCMANKNYCDRYAQ